MQQGHSSIHPPGVLAQRIPWKSTLSGNVSCVQLTDTEERLGYLFCL